MRRSGGWRIFQKKLMDLIGFTAFTGGSNRAESPEFAEIFFQGDELWQIEAVIDPASGLASLDELGVFEGFEVEGEFGLADVEDGAEIADATFPIAQQIQDLETQWVRQRLEARNQ
jgi:hypothetical protein